MSAAHDLLIAILTVLVLAGPLYAYWRRLHDQCEQLRRSIQALERSLREERAKALREQAEWQRATGQLFPFLAPPGSEALRVPSGSRGRLH